MGSVSGRLWIVFSDIFLDPTSSADLLSFRETRSKETDTPEDLEVFRARGGYDGGAVDKEGEGKGGKYLEG